MQRGLVGIQVQRATEAQIAAVRAHVEALHGAAPATGPLGEKGTVACPQCGGELRWTRQARTGRLGFDCCNIRCRLHYTEPLPEEPRPSRLRRWR
ncbi:MAG TPA: hypothetical protein PLZ36_12730 [Armatimonadota bacterium]|nr:hypothetical protein [Armatimonadota bacterium]